MISGQMLSRRPRFAQHEEQRADHRQHGEEAGHEDENEDRAGAADRHPRQRVAGQRRDDQRDQRGQAGDDRAVDERRQEPLLGEVLAVGGATQVRGDDAVRPADPLADGLIGEQRRAQDPVEREQRDQDHHQHREVEADLAHDSPYLRPARRGVGAARDTASGPVAADSVVMSCPSFA